MLSLCQFCFLSCCFSCNSPSQDVKRETCDTKKQRCQESQDVKTETCDTKKQRCQVFFINFVKPWSGQQVFFINFANSLKVYNNKSSSLLPYHKKLFQISSETTHLSYNITTNKSSSLLPYHYKQVFSSLTISIQHLPFLLNGFFF